MYLVALIVSLLVATGAAVDDIQTFCPNSVLESIDPYYLHVNNGSCFHFAIYKSKEYDEANQECVEDGGTLAMPKTKSINDYLRDIILNQYMIRGDIWIGLNDLVKEDVFVWEDGDPMGWDNFADGNGLDNNFVSAFVEDCAALDVESSLWHDFQCFSNLITSITKSKPRKKFVCQYTLNSTDDQEKQDTQNLQDVQDAIDAQNTQDKQDAEDTSDAQDPQDPEDAQDTPDAQVKDDQEQNTKSKRSICGKN
ncbi:collectin-11 [Plakobranchus ocellatus]|uniref:Collectin-11 n=1 Tax=Plakobranchus ocellatus TaxID=259542 RepID=A0AAV3Z321_9GAST|nr:collectin-11 [Plakobranchus ocellatus]